MIDTKAVNDYANKLKELAGVIDSMSIVRCSLLKKDSNLQLNGVDEHGNAFSAPLAALIDNNLDNDVRNYTAAQLRLNIQETEKNIEQMMGDKTPKKESLEEKAERLLKANN